MVNVLLYISIGGFIQSALQFSYYCSQYFYCHVSPYIQAYYILHYIYMQLMAKTQSSHRRRVPATLHTYWLLLTRLAWEVHSGVEYGALRDSSGLGDQLGLSDDSQMSCAASLYEWENSAPNWCGGGTAAAAGAVRPTHSVFFGLFFRRRKQTNCWGSVWMTLCWATLLPN